MLHRHITPVGYSSAAIDDVISRGSLRDWIEMRDAALADTEIMKRIGRVARARAIDSYQQRHHFWMHYAEEHSPSLRAKRSNPD
jgi:hypothetical protein